MQKASVVAGLVERRNDEEEVCSHFIRFYYILYMRIHARIVVQMITTTTTSVVLSKRMLPSGRSIFWVCNCVSISHCIACIQTYIYISVLYGLNVWWLKTSEKLWMILRHIKSIFAWNRMIMVHAHKRSKSDIIPKNRLEKAKVQRDRERIIQYKYTYVVLYNMYSLCAIDTKTKYRWNEHV